MLDILAIIGGACIVYGSWTALCREETMENYDSGLMWAILGSALLMAAALAMPTAQAEWRPQDPRMARVTASGCAHVPVCTAAEGHEPYSILRLNRHFEMMPLEGGSCIMCRVILKPEEWIYIQGGDYGR